MGIGTPKSQSKIPRPMESSVMVLPWNPQHPQWLPRRTTAALGSLLADPPAQRHELIDRRRQLVAIAIP